MWWRDTICWLKRAWCEVNLFFLPFFPLVLFWITDPLLAWKLWTPPFLQLVRQKWPFTENKVMLSEPDNSLVGRDMGGGGIALSSLFESHCGCLGSHCIPSVTYGCTPSHFLLFVLPSGISFFWLAGLEVFVLYSLQWVCLASLIRIYGPTIVYTTPSRSRWENIVFYKYFEWTSKRGH